MTRELITFPQGSGPNTHQITGLKKKEEIKPEVSNFQDTGGLSSESSMWAQQSLNSFLVTLTENREGYSSLSQVNCFLDNFLLRLVSSQTYSFDLGMPKTKASRVL